MTNRKQELIIAVYALAAVICAVFTIAAENAGVPLIVICLACGVIGGNTGLLVEWIQNHK